MIVRSLSRAVALFLILLLVARPASAQSPEADAVTLDSVQTQRLADLTKLYSVVSFYHPDLRQGTAAWDSAFAASAQRIATTTASDAYAEAVRDLVDALDDPATRIRPPRGSRMPPPPRDDSSAKAVRWAADSVLVATLNPTTLRGRSDVVEFQRAFRARLPKAQGVVMDVRDAGPAPVGQFLDSQDDLMARLTPERYAPPRVQTRMHEGFPAENRETSGGYASYTRTRAGRVIDPAAATNTGPVVLIASAGGTVPKFALALQDAGHGTILREGAEGAPIRASVPTHSLSLTGGHTVEIRRGELVFADGTQPAGAARILPASPDTTDPALERALAMARGETPLPSVPDVAPAEGMSTESDFTSASYPSLGTRLLAVARAWSIIDHFFPYKELADEPWANALPQALKRAAAATTAEDYHLAVAHMVTRTDDSHVSARSDVLTDVLGAASAPVLVRSIEGQPVVTRVVDEAVADTTDIERGNVVVSVDGTPATARLDSLARFLRGFSTPHARRFYTAMHLLDGSPERTASVRVRGAEGNTRTVELPRGKYNLYSGPNEGPVLRRLTDRIGYADLDRLPRSQVDSMFTRFSDTDAIVFDMRGYPKGTAWMIAPRLAETQRPVGASFARPLRMGPTEIGRQTVEFDQRIPPRRGPRYTGETVMLIDARTISQAEHTGLFFKAANGTTFVGSPTNGANGDVTQFVLPGDITVTFTGQAVRHPDGTQLQRRGLQPDIEARPTIEDIRNGEDVVLETAIEHLQTRLSSDTP